MWWFLHYFLFALNKLNSLVDRNQMFFFIFFFLFVSSWIFCSRLKCDCSFAFSILLVNERDCFKGEYYRLLVRDEHVECSKNWWQISYNQTNFYSSSTQLARNVRQLWWQPQGELLRAYFILLWEKYGSLEIFQYKEIFF